ncbi:MAG: hypothetical protein WBH40_12675 [Ignavibacteriaceae bacterium]
MIDPLLIAAGVCGFLCILFLFAFIAAIRKRKVLGAVRNFTFTFLMLVLALLFATITVSLKGYQALTHEELAATVEIMPVSDQKFIARFTFPDSTIAKFELAGDELYVDAHILKWKSLANLFGLHTFYELDRVAGRYSEIEEETSKDRTVFSLGKEKMVNIFDLRLEYELLSFLLDAKYGSASFVNVSNSAKFNIMVSTTGLLIRTEE